MAALEQLNRKQRQAERKATAETNREAINQAFDNIVDRLGLESTYTVERVIAGRHDSTLPKWLLDATKRAYAKASTDLPPAVLICQHTGEDVGFYMFVDIGGALLKLQEESADDAGN